MSVEENVELMRRWFKEVWNEGRTQTIHDLLLLMASESENTRMAGRFGDHRSSCHL